jgi:phytoene dehydrogenase-like protein
MPGAHVHDVIVVGSEPAGLMAAGLLRRRGYRVLLVGQGGLRDQLERPEGPPLPLLPRFLPRRAQAPALDEVLDALGLEDAVHPLGRNGHTRLQVVTPEQRVDLFVERERLAVELERAAPEQKQAVLAGLDEIERLDAGIDQRLEHEAPLPPAGLRERLRLRRAEPDWEGWTPWPTAVPDGWPPLLQMVARATGFACGLDLEHRARAASARLMRMWLGGARLVPELSRRLTEAVAGAGVTVEPKMVAEQLLFQGRRIDGIQALRSADRHHSRLLIAALPSAEAAGLVPGARRRPRAKLAAAALRPQTSAFVLQLLLPREALPLGMGDHVLLVRDPRAPLQEDNLIQLVVLAHPERAGWVQLCAACPMAYRNHSLGREYLGPLQQRMLEAIGWLVPFFQQHGDEQISPFWSERASDPGHPSPWSLQRTVEPLAPPELGLGVLPLQSPLRGLLLCGAETIPGLGLEGQARAAARCAAWIGDELRLKHPLDKARPAAQKKA